MCQESHVANKELTLSFAVFIPGSDVDTRTLYHISMQLRHDVEEAADKSEKLWPPEAQHMSLDVAMTLEPVLLAWIVGAPDSYAQETAVEVSPVMQRKILSVVQDILNLSHRGRLFLPKHYALVMAVRHLTGSSTVIRLLNGLGHSMSHTAVLEHDTALAETQLSKTSYVPDGFCKRTFTTLVWDNNDWGGDLDWKGDHPQHQRHYRPTTSSKSGRDV
jgi:hypothetical protein